MRQRWLTADQPDPRKIALRLLLLAVIAAPTDVGSAAVAAPSQHSAPREEGAGTEAEALALHARSDSALVGRRREVVSAPRPRRRHHLAAPCYARVIRSDNGNTPPLHLRC